MTYNVFSGTLNPTHSLTLTHWRIVYIPRWLLANIVHISHAVYSVFDGLLLRMCFMFVTFPNWGDGGVGHWLVQMEWRPAGWSVCLPLLIFPCTIKSRSSLLAPAHPGCPGKRAVKRSCICVCAFPNCLDVKFFSCHRSYVSVIIWFSGKNTYVYVY